MSGYEDEPHLSPFSASQVELHHSTSTGEFTIVNALMHLPQEQGGIQLVPIRIREHPFDCPRSQMLDHVRQIASCFGKNVLRDIWPRAGAAFNYSVELEVAETSNE